MHHSPLNRRDFLKLGLLSLSGMALRPLRALQGETYPPLPPPELSGQQGRVLAGNIHVYRQPSFDSPKVKTYWRDTVLPITGVTIGDAEPAYNRVWYRIGVEGFAHSGNIQPVRTTLNEPVEIPKGGALVEVTVPYTEARWGASEKFSIAYRLYYETTHWAEKLVHDASGHAWYRLLEDKWALHYYVPARHVRVVPREELAPLSPQVPPEAKRLEVRLAQQIVIAYEYDRPVFMARAATGAVFSNGNFTTPIGRHYTKHKRPSRHMAAGEIGSNGYDLPGVPWVSYITKKGVAFHGTYWHNDYGRPRSHGCINLTPKASKWIYRWTLPTVPPDAQRLVAETGTRVDVI
ncbi:MAG: murein L,D-transpeptidase [Anaerolineae bacterium]|nr:MAG: murein L,D-transpeptidase [Anaerolineae bacterium]